MGTKESRTWSSLNAFQVGRVAQIQYLKLSSCRTIQTWLRRGVAVIAKRAWDLWAFLGGLSALRKCSSWQLRQVTEQVECCSLLPLLKPQQQPVHTVMLPKSQPLLKARSSMHPDGRRHRGMGSAKFPPPSLQSQPRAGVRVINSKLCSVCTRLPLPSSTSSRQWDKEGKKDAIGGLIVRLTCRKACVGGEGKSKGDWRRQAHFPLSLAPSWHSLLFLSLPVLGAWPCEWNHS